MEPLRGNEPLLPGYELVGRLGSGGFGTVYAAVDSRGERVAIKVLRPELSDDRELLSRLEREAAALKKVTGEHTAKIHEVNTAGDHAFLVMDLIEGQNLEEHVRTKGPLKGFELRVVVEELVAALSEIHRAGVIHRDLKPSNVMYGPAGITLLDFGISSIADSTALTKSGAFIGTAGWISPEQIEGRPVTAATDVFNLGLVVAYAATGQHPFGTGRPEGIMYRICHHDPDLGDLGEPIRGLVVECLNRDENSRVSIEQVAGFIESDYTSSWADLARVAAVQAAPTDFEYSETKRVQDRSSRRQSTVIVSPGGQPLPQGAATEPKSSKRGVLVLASIAVLASLAAVVALVTSGSQPQTQAADELSAVQTEPTDSSTVDATIPSETLAEDLEPQEAVTVGSEPPATEPVIEVSGVSARPATPTTQAPAPTTTQPPVPGAIDGAPQASGFRTELIDSGNDFEVISVSFELTDLDGVSGSSVRLRRSDGQLIPGCPSQAFRISGTQNRGTWKAECVIRDSQTSTQQSRYFSLEHCSSDLKRNQVCQRLGSFESFLVGRSTSTSSAATSSTTSTSTTTTTLAPQREPNPPEILSVRSSRSTYKRYETVTFIVEVADASGIENVTFRLQGFYKNGFDCWGSQYANFPKRSTFEFSCKITPYAAGPYVAWVQSTDYWNNFHSGIGVNTGYQIHVDFPMVRLPDLYKTQVTSAEETLRAVGYEGVLSFSPGWCPPARGSGYRQGDIIGMTFTQLVSVDVPITISYVSGGFNEEGSCP